VIKIILVIGTKTGKTFQKEIEENQIENIVGLKIGDEFDGSLVGLMGYNLQVTGASDKEGFPSKRNIEGANRVSIVLTPGIGFKNANRNGYRRRKSIRGNTISEQIAQLNIKIIKEGKKSVEELWNLNNIETVEDKNSKST